MTDKEKKKKKYEPPVVREIGGVFDQAMGVSKCEYGGLIGRACSRGGWDVGCIFGSTDGGSCTRGVGNDTSCRSGPWVGWL